MGTNRALRVRLPRGTCCLVAVVLFLSGCGSSLFLHPDRDLITPPALARYLHEDLWVTAPDGVRLHGWDLHPAGEARGALVFFHGNAGNLGDHVGSVLWLVDAGYRLLGLDYRGFGRSEGEADVAGAHADAAAFLEAVLARKDLDLQRIAVLGQSFGGGVAIHAVATSAEKERVRLLIVDSAFSSYRQIAAEKAAGCLCIWPLNGAVAGRFKELDDLFMPEKWAPAVSPVPLLVLHGDRDPVVPVDHGRRLHRVAREPKGFWLVEGAGHVRAFGSAGLRERLVEVLAERMNSGNGPGNN